jgi:ribosomal protein S27AE
MQMLDKSMADVTSLAHQGPQPMSSVLSRHAAQNQAARDQVGRGQNACGRCGATSYKSLMARDASGAMRASGRYQCVQCQRVFASVQDWKQADTPISSDAVLGRSH